MQLTEQWMAFGVGKHFKNQSVRDITETLGEIWLKILPIFHALTGCNTTFFFASTGKKAAWELWKVYSEATEAFLALEKRPATLSDEAFCTVERFTILICNKSSQNENINTERQDVFERRIPQIENTHHPRV